MQRILIEGKFGQGKNGYRLDYIRAKRANTSFAWINSIFLVMNLFILQRIFFGLCKLHSLGFIGSARGVWEQMIVNQPTYFNLSGRFAYCSD